MASTIELNLGEAQGVLERAARQLTDTTQLMQQFGEYTVASTNARFDSKTAPDGTAWAANSLLTISRKGHADILRGRSGALRLSIYYSASRNLLIWGSPRDYAGVMQRGAAKGAFGQTSRGQPIPFGTIPARPFIGLSELDRQMLGEIATKWLKDAFE